MPYRIIVNAPGYLPDMEPYDVPTFEAAIASLKDELSETRESVMLSNDSQETFAAILAEVNAFRFEGSDTSILAVQYGGLAHTIALMQPGAPYDHDHT